MMIPMAVIYMVILKLQQDAIKENDTSHHHDHKDHNHKELKKPLLSNEGGEHDQTFE